MMCDGGIGVSGCNHFQAIIISIQNKPGPTAAKTGESRFFESRFKSVNASEIVGQFLSEGGWNDFFGRIICLAMPKEIVIPALSGIIEQGGIDIIAGCGKDNIPQ